LAIGSSTLKIRLKGGSGMITWDQFEQWCKINGWRMRIVGGDVPQLKFEKRDMNESADFVMCMDASELLRKLRKKDEILKEQKEFVF
jgi:hypothetical protein